MKRRFILTFDTDWAPQFVLDHVLEKIRCYDLPATLFCTSAYEIPEDMDLEIGVHPNFMPGSTHGDDEVSCIEHVRKLYPEAVGSRSHRYYWHSGLRPLLQRHGFHYDASIFCPLQSHLEGYDFYGLKRFPVWWGDGFHMLRGLGTDGFKPPGLDEPGLKILVFHPIHIYCNTKDLDKTKSRLAKIRLPEATEGELEPIRHAGKGVETLFDSVLKIIREKENAVRLEAVEVQPVLF